MAEKIILHWSGGKDSSLTLERLLQNPQWNVVGLWTTYTPKYQRVSMHGTPITLIQLQAQRIGVPLTLMPLEENASMKDYEKQFTKYLLRFKKQGVHHIAFGDIFLEDLKHYRETLLKRFGMQAHFPLWGENTYALAQDFVKRFKAVITSVNGKMLSKEWAGRVLDEACLKSLPDEVDPCGENGEFHTFVYDAPFFSQPIPIQIKNTIERTYHYQNQTFIYYFADLAITTP